MDVDALSLGLLPLRSVLLDTLDEVLPGTGVPDVLNTDVDALLHVSVADLLLAIHKSAHYSSSGGSLHIQDNANSVLSHVVDNASLAVVDLVRHTLLHGTYSAVSPSVCGFQSTVCVFVPLATTSTISPTLYWWR